MQATVTVFTTSGTYPVVFSKLSEALAFYEALEQDDHILKAELTSNLAPDVIIAFDRS